MWQKKDIIEIHVAESGKKTAVDLATLIKSDMTISITIDSWWGNFSNLSEWEECECMRI